MAFLRTLLLWVIFVPITLIYFIFILLSIPLPRRIRHKVGGSWNKTFVWLMKHITGLSYRVEGLENVSEEPCIICSKHQSSFETFTLQRFLPDQVFLMKKELMWFPIFGISLYIMNSVPVDRNNKDPKNREKLLKAVDKRRKAGFWINIFPEGTRVAPGKKGRYHYGAAHFAKRLHMDILPVATNSGEFWPKGFVIYPGVVDFVIGPPISYKQGTAEEIMKRCENWIENTQERITGKGPFTFSK